MATAESNLPIDTSVTIPAAVKAATERANAFYQQPTTPEKTNEPASQGAAEPSKVAPEGDKTPVEGTADPGTKAAPVEKQTPTAVTPAPDAATSKTPVTEEQWEHRYLSMKGRYDASQRTIGEMQEQMQQLGDELVRTQHLVQRGNNYAKEPPQQPVKLITDKDEENYGKELIDLAQRAAKEALLPEVESLKQENQRLKQQRHSDAQSAMRAALTQAVPNWRQVNTHPDFLAWLRLPDVYSGQLRGQMLKAASQAADAPRVIAFFKGFLNEAKATGHIPDAQSSEPQKTAPRTPAVAIETLASPGRPKPASGSDAASNAPVDKPVITRAQIRDFYNRVRQGAYAGRDTEKARDEAVIFSAQNEGRVRG